VHLGSACGSIGWVEKPLRSASDGPPDDGVIADPVMPVDEVHDIPQDARQRFAVHAGRPNAAPACDASVNAAEPVTPAVDDTPSSESRPKSRPPNREEASVSGSTTIEFLASFWRVGARDLAS
jgi:hypothetical protein